MAPSTPTQVLKETEFVGGEADETAINAMGIELEYRRCLIQTGFERAKRFQIFFYISYISITDGDRIESFAYWITCALVFVEASLLPETSKKPIYKISSVAFKMEASMCIGKPG